jgi:hypothetical protein
MIGDATRAPMTTRFAITATTIRTRMGSSGTRP